MEFHIYIGDVYIKIKLLCTFRTLLNCSGTQPNYIFSLNTYINYERHILTLSSAIFLIPLVTVAYSNFEKKKSWCHKEIKIFSVTVVILELEWWKTFVKVLEFSPQDQNSNMGKCLFQHQVNSFGWCSFTEVKSNEICHIFFNMVMIKMEQDYILMYFFSQSYNRRERKFTNFLTF